MSISKYCHRCHAIKPQGHRHKVATPRPSPRKRGYDAQHQRDRKDFLAMFPVCQWPEGCLSPATELDHVDGDPLNKDWGNYRGYCKSHHSKRTAQDQPGGWNAPGYQRSYDE